ncbi:MAG: tetratricopeptide repeat protein [Planctomycetaceae bacterium]
MSQSKTNASGGNGNRAGRRRNKPLLMVLPLLAAGFCLAWWLRPDILYRVARYQYEHRPQEASQTLEYAVALRNDNFPSARLLWSRALLKSGRLGEAEACFNQISDPSGLPGTELLQFADEAIAAQSVFLAAMILKSIPPTAPEFPEAIRTLVRISFESGQWQAVVRFCEPPSVKSILSPVETSLLADSCVHLQRFPEAVTLFEDVLKDIRTDSSTFRNCIASVTDILLKLGDKSRRILAEQSSAGRFSRNAVAGAPDASCKAAADEWSPR